MTRDDVMMMILHTDRRYIIVHVPIERIGELQPGTRLFVLFPGHDLCEGVVANLPMIGEKQLANGKSRPSVRVESVGRPWPELPISSKVEVLTQ